MSLGLQRISNALSIDGPYPNGLRTRGALARGETSRMIRARRAAQSPGSG